MRLFRHLLIQDTAYESLLRSTRQGYHRRIVEVLEERFPETAEAQPELLAHHYKAGGRHEEAVGYWQKAGEQARQRSAHVEAISHLYKGLELLSPLPETPEHVQKELDFLVALGASLMVTKGWSSPEVGHVYSRAHTLCQQIEDDAQWVRILDGQRRFYAVREELQPAREFAEELLAVAQRTQNREYLLKAHYGLGYTLNYQGLFVPDYEHWEQCLALYDAQQHRSLALSYGVDPGVHCLIYSAVALGHLGYVNQSVARRDEALTLAQELSHPFSLTVALALAAFAHEICREWQQVQAYAESAIALGTEYGFTQYTLVGTISRGRALAMQGDPEAGMAQIHQGVALIQSTGAKLLQPHYLALLAEACGNVEEGLGYLSEALAIAEKTGARWYEAELYRLKGQCLLQQSPNNQTEAEAGFQQAISIAQNQSAKSWELRAATSLARLWQQQGKREAARELLEPVYGWFTEGFDTADLIDAKMLLDELS